MGSPFDRVQAGSPFSPSATVWNDLLDMLRWFKTSRTESSGGRGGQQPKMVELLIKNTTESSIDRFGVMGLDDPIFGVGSTNALNSFKNQCALKGVTPDIGVHWGKFAVALEPIGAGKFGRCCVSGCVPCKINVYQSGHQWADIKDGDATQLNSDDCGTCKILWKESGTGTGKWAYVLIGESALTGFCVAQEDVDPNVAADFKFSTRSGTEYGPVVQMTWAAGSDAGTIATDAVCFRTRIGDEWIVSPVECP